MRNRMRWTVLALVAAGGLAGSRPIAAQGILGTAQQFSVLGASTVTNTNPTTIWGDIGVWPGPDIVGLAEVTHTGAVHQTDPVAMQAQADAFGAYASLAALSPTINLSGINLSGLLLTPGVYFFSSEAMLSGVLTLDFLGNPNSQFVFQIGSALTTASGSTVNVINGTSGGGVFWQVGSSATLGSGSLFQGNIIADQSVTLVSAAKILCGRAIALNAAVTMDNNTISNSCTEGSDGGTGITDFGSYGYAGIEETPVHSVPEPSAWMLLFLGLAAFALVRIAPRKTIAMA